MDKKEKEKFDKLLTLMKEEDFYLKDFLFCICANLVNNPKDEFRAGLEISGNFFDITIKKKGIVSNGSISRT